MSTFKLNAREQAADSARYAAWQRSPEGIGRLDQWIGNGPESGEADARSYTAEAEFYAEVQTHILPPELRPAAPMIERLARFLRDDGVVHRTPPQTWEGLPEQARQQWRETAKRYLAAALGKPS